MRRALFNLCGTVVAGALVGALLLWPRSYWRAYWWGHSGNDSYWTVQSTRGGVHFFYRSGFAASDRGWRFDSAPPFVLIRETMVHTPWYERMGFFAHYAHYRARPMPGGGSDVMFALPYWFVALASASGVGLWLAPR